ncbi:metallophosphoesterase [Dinoroseobacter shibae DFL 12 = DSM 16493]|uniref:Metallophosphoesterase n=1 Tax=Dinoroseobacter shibae (strain DSM 16493 / NCIMB 14021 / DFL 12) TaxID=398580 RepID=A8LNM9_DINSH|nr:metallophosphoesterase family protein [Dinoroseobacter shibae]ABV95123.1 metallophosphoesterase [Dinoroseobacter shibae DFL 12 = DSM 16493]URF50843.1 serine/threonine protein phosphatase [Dinoroseobacter shibae]
MWSLFRRKSAAPEVLPPPVPEGLTYVVGDIHGRLDLLEHALELIQADRGSAAASLVFLGDYVDRGPDSAGVLNRLFKLRIADVEVICLMGNHERMMLDFLDDPDRRGDRWLRNGGTETLASFAPARADPRKGQSRLEALRDSFLDTIEPELLYWMRSLPLSWRSGSLGCVHAITDPAQAWEAQDEDILLWGRPSPALIPRSDGIWVAHGHTIVDQSEAVCGHIALDTGAYRTGRLSVLRCDDRGIKFFSATAP